MLTYNRKGMGEIFRRQHRSQYSEKSNVKRTSPFDKEDPNNLNDIEIEIQNIKDAIDELDENTVAETVGIPAIFFIKTKEVIAMPPTLMLRRSLDEGNIPDIFKMAYITPIHKGDQSLNQQTTDP